ncbi:nuclear transport factor 2 family protein, partial [Variovorax sp. CT11-76]
MTTTTTTASNKAFIQHIHAQLDQGNSRPFLEGFADDATWKLEGSTAWSRTYRGRKAIREELLNPLFAQFATPYTSRTEHVLADEDRVVVQFSGDVLTHAGRRYNNRYCYVYRLEGGLVKELIEYFDTGLVASALEAPASAGAGTGTGTARAGSPPAPPPGGEKLFNLVNTAPRRGGGVGYGGV